MVSHAWFEWSVYFSFFFVVSSVFSFSALTVVGRQENRKGIGPVKSWVLVVHFCWQWLFDLSPLLQLSQPLPSFLASIKPSNQVHLDKWRWNWERDRERERERVLSQGITSVHVSFRPPTRPSVCLEFIPRQFVISNSYSRNDLRRLFKKDALLHIVLKQLAY